MKLRFLKILIACLTAATANAQQTNEPYAAEVNWALNGGASQSSTLELGTAERAIDGNTDGNYASNSTTHSGGSDQDGDPRDPYWEVDLGDGRSIGSVHVWFRTDCCGQRNDDFTVLILNSSRTEVARWSYPGRPPRDAKNGLHYLYNMATPVVGHFVRFVPQNPLTTSDGFFSLAEVQVIAPYQGVAVNLTQNLVSASVSEGRVVTLGPVAATVTGAPQDRLTYQWLRNGQEIPGANGSTYTTPVQRLADSGTAFTVRCSVSGQSVLSGQGVVTVTPDVERPVINELSFGSGPAMRAIFRFNEVMDPVSSVQVANYDFGPGTTVTRAILSPILQDPADQHLYQTVTLEVTGIAQNAPYSVAVSGAKDLAGNELAGVTRSGTTPFFEVNWAMGGSATQSSTALGGEAEHAIDGNTDGFFANGSVTLNEVSEDPGWWEVDLGATKPIGRLKVWFRTLTAAECQALFNSCAVRNDDFTLQILDASQTVIWSRTYPGRPSLQVAYNLPPGINGRHVRFESQSPLRTGDGYFSLAEVQVIAPYENAAVTLTKDLNPTETVTENRRLTLGPLAATVSGVAGAPADVLTYQWQQNGVDIRGANASAYQTPALSLGQSGLKYRCNLLLSGQVLASTETVVTVAPDTEAPTLKSVAGGFSRTEVTIIFSEPVSEATASVAANYSLSGGLEITGITVLTLTSVRLTTSLQLSGTAYTLTARQIRDLAGGGGNVILANSTLSFRALQSDANRFVVVGDAGNPKDTVWNTARGAVAYVYEISKFKVSNAEYAAFLNATAKTDTHSLWASPEIVRDGEEGTYTYTVVAGLENRPARWVATVDALRLANWLSNGAEEGSDTESGTYTFTGAETFSARNPNSDYFLPSESEWFKAAYYDPTKNGIGGYWQYPVKTDDPNALVAELPPGGPFSANFNSVNGADGGTTDVGAYTAATSYYGTYDQAGNTWEWNEPADPASGMASRMSGSWANAINRLSANVVANNGVGNGGQSEHQGFRLARAHRVRLEFVTVGNPGNPKDTVWNAARGSVDSVYEIGKFKVSNAQYAIFLNAKAKNDPNSLWGGGGEILQEGEAGNFRYTVVEGRENRPVRWVAAVDAMRLANWLNNGGSELSDTETGSYTFSGYDVVTARNPAAHYVLPSEDEWYKAAYHDPTKNGVGGYWQFPMRIDDPTALVAELPPGGPFSANFDSVNAADGGSTDIGAYSAAGSYYGTFDQAGGAWEWNEPTDPAAKVASRRSGSWANAIARLSANVIANNAIGNGGQSEHQSFRLARVIPKSAVPILQVISVSPTSVSITWAGGGVLESTSVLGGQWTPLPNASSPYLSNPADAPRLFRVRLP